MSEIKKKRGPRAKHPDGFKELHLKFSGALRAHIENVTAGGYQAYGGCQAYFDQLVRQDLEKMQTSHQ